jgi:dTDP-4-amino-4,6-dideoxygalactose transaminase
VEWPIPTTALSRKVAADSDQVVVYWGRIPRTKEVDVSKLALLGGDPVRKEPYPEWPAYSTNEEEAAVLAALRSDHLCGVAGGTFNSEFESAFAMWCGAPGAVTCNSGSSALQVALAAIGVGPGDEVIVPAYTYYSSGTSVLMTGAIPVFADILPGEANLDSAAFEAAITDQTKALIVVHADGVPADMDAISAIASRYGVLIVEDCSHAHGAAYKGVRTGILGDVGAFSIQHKKILSVGEGGVVVSRDADIVARARTYVNLGDGTRTGELGPNLRMGEMSGALAIVRMRRVDAENERRRENANLLRSQTADLPGIKPVPNEVRADIEAVYYNFIFSYDAKVTGISREHFAEAVQAEGLPLKCGFYEPLNLLPVFTKQEAWPYRLQENQTIVRRGLYGPGKCPVAEAFLDKGHLELKVHPPAGEREMKEVAAAMRKVIEHADSLVKRKAG